MSRKREQRIRGVISITRKGVGYVAVNTHLEDTEIAPEKLGTALHGDEVEIEHAPRKENRRQGEVVKVLRRAKKEFVGTLVKKSGSLFLIPDDKRFYKHIEIEGTLKNVGKDTKAVVEMLAWKDPKENPRGEILELLGKKGLNETEMKAIVREHGFKSEFEKHIEEEAEAIKAKGSITEEEVEQRRDFRDAVTLTIDPSDAKDFDDALSIKKLPQEKFEIGIHIADVSHFVRPGSALDTEARKRGTSIYLVDRTIPMLPEVLSNDLCSLNPLEEKLAYSAVFIIDKEGEVHRRWFGKTIIRSRKRFTYEEAQRVLDTKQGLFFDELQTLNAIAKKLQIKRAREGSIDFDQEEVKFVLDNKGVPLEVRRKKRLDTNELIEDFMLLANREVASYFQKIFKDKKESTTTFIYRVHDVPNPEKIEELGIFLRAIGYDFESKKGEVSAKEINKLFKEIEGAPEENLIKKATIRAMAKAIYSTKNIGHFGLSFAHYTHFTSPIRRYPDIMVHRILKDHLNGEKISKKEVFQYEKLALESSQREVEAIEAERDSIKLKQVEYMKNHVGEEFNGVITGVVDWGLYVEEKETKAEGLIRIRTLSDDFYEVDKKHYRLVGTKSKKAYALGDALRIKLISADLEERTLEWGVAKSI